jgi:hypothetical protein
LHCCFVVLQIMTYFASHGYNKQLRVILDGTTVLREVTRFVTDAIDAATKNDSDPETATNGYGYATTVIHVNGIPIKGDDLEKTLSELEPGGAHVWFNNPNREHHMLHLQQLEDGDLFVVWAQGPGGLNETVQPGTEQYELLKGLTASTGELVLKQLPCGKTFVTWPHDGSASVLDSEDPLLLALAGQSWTTIANVNNLKVRVIFRFGPGVDASKTCILKPGEDLSAFWERCLALFGMTNDYHMVCTEHGQEMTTSEGLRQVGKHLGSANSGMATVMVLRRPQGDGTKRAHDDTSAGGGAAPVAKKSRPSHDDASAAGGAAPVAKKPQHSDKNEPGSTACPIVVEDDTDHDAANCDHLGTCKECHDSKDCYPQEDGGPCTFCDPSAKKPQHLRETEDGSAACPIVID